MQSQTSKNLLTAMHGEAFAFAKYSLFAEQARKGGNVKLAELFEQTARVERLEHFSEEAQLAGIVGTDAENLRDALAGENAEIETMYREFAEQADVAGDSVAAERFREIRGDEMGHRDAFRSSLQELDRQSVRPLAPSV